MSATETSTHPAAQLVGTVLDEWEMVIERGKVAEFARATGSAAAQYFAPDAPVPPTFLVTSTFWAPAGGPPLAKRLGLDLPMVLHGGQEFSFPNGLPRVGETLRVVQSVESVTPKQGKRGGSMTVIVLLTRFTRPDGEIAAESRTTTIERARSTS